jgi:hypothetical protein
MRLVLLSLFSIILFSCGINRAVYKSPDFDAKATTHQTIAILPFKITQTGHVAKNETSANIKEANEKWGYVFQESLHSYVLKQTAKNKKGPMVQFQAPQKTNALLTQNNLRIEDMYDRTPEELARLLNVDAVLMTTLEKDKNFSDGVAYGLAAGRTIVNILSKNVSPVPGVNASDINMNSALYDKEDSKLLWKTYRNGGTDLPNNVDDLVKYYSNWIAKKLPYKS